MLKIFSEVICSLFGHKYKETESTMIVKYNNMCFFRVRKQCTRCSLQTRKAIIVPIQYTHTFIDKMEGRNEKWPEFNYTIIKKTQ